MRILFYNKKRRNATQKPGFQQLTILLENNDKDSRDLCSNPNTYHNTCYIVPTQKFGFNTSKNIPDT